MKYKNITFQYKSECELEEYFEQSIWVGTIDLFVEDIFTNFTY